MKVVTNVLWALIFCITATLGGCAVYVLRHMIKFDVWYRAYEYQMFALALGGCAIGIVTIVILRKRVLKAA